MCDRDPRALWASLTPCPALGVNDLWARCARRPAPQVEKMRRREYADPLVVGQHPVTIDARVVVAIDHHKCRAHSGQLPEEVLVRRSMYRREHDAVDLAAAQHLKLGALFTGVLPGAAQEQPISAHAGNRLDTRDDLYEERVHQVWNDDPDRVAAPERQTARNGVALISELFDLRENAAPSRRADVPCLFKHVLPQSRRRRARAMRALFGAGLFCPLSLK